MSHQWEQIAKSVDSVVAWCAIRDEVFSENITPERILEFDRFTKYCCRHLLQIGKDSTANRINFLRRGLWNLIQD